MSQAVWWEGLVIVLMSIILTSLQLDETGPNVELAIDTGGWYTDPSSRLAEPGPCNIDVMDGTMTQEQFMQWFAHRAPVVIRGATDNAAFQELCRKASLMSEHGDKKIRLSSANTHSYSKRDVTLNHYVNNVMKPQKLGQLGNETFYWFGDNNYTEWESFISAYSAPKYTLPDMTGAYSFGMAGAGTGVPFHFHGPGFAEVIFGRKRWFFYPPEKTPYFNGDRTTLHWLIEEYPKLHPDDLPLECTLNQGELIYFPDRWWHGTLNLDTSIFISTFLAH